VTELKLAGVGRIISGKVIFVPSPDWQDASDFHTGTLLRLCNQPIDACESGAQRRGWWNEHARQTYVPKPREWDVVTVTDEDLPY
jgi:hypothetical protein